MFFYVCKVRVQLTARPFIFKLNQQLPLRNDNRQGVEKISVTAQYCFFKDMASIKGLHRTCVIAYFG